MPEGLFVLATHPETVDAAEGLRERRPESSVSVKEVICRKRRENNQIRETGPKI